MYVLATANADAPAVFTWPNPCRKFIRDTYTADGRLALPPEGRLKLTRHKVNPKAGGRVIAMASLVDRSGGKAAFDVPFFPLIRLDVPTYQPDALPPELAAIPAIKPGSRAA